MRFTVLSSFPYFTKHLWSELPTTSQQNYLIASVVDCCAASIKHNDTTRSKFYFLLRSTTDPDEVLLLTLALSVQEFWIPTETQACYASVASLTSINDVRASAVKRHVLASLGYPFSALAFQAFEFLHADSNGFVWLKSVARDPLQSSARPSRPLLARAFILETCLQERISGASSGY